MSSEDFVLIEDPCDEFDAMVIEQPLRNLSLRSDGMDCETSLCSQKTTESDGPVDQFKSMTTTSLQLSLRSDVDTGAAALNRLPTSQPSLSDLFHSLKDKVTGLDLLVVDLGGVGDCMFRALSHQIDVVCARKIFSRELRNQVVKHLRENPERLGVRCADFVNESELNADCIHQLEKLSGEARVQKRWELYLVNIEREATWGDNICLQAASDMLGLTIEVVYSIRNRDNHILEPVVRETTGHGRLMLGHVQEQHYVSVVCSKSSAGNNRNNVPTQMRSNSKSDLMVGGPKTVSDAVPFYSSDVSLPSSHSSVSLKSNLSSPGAAESTVKTDDFQFDVFLIYCEDDFYDVNTFKELLVKFISPALNRDVTFCMEQMDMPLIANYFDFVSAALKSCRWKFIFIGPNYNDDNNGLLKFLKHSALMAMIKSRDNSIVPIKALPGARMPEFLDMYRPIDVNRLLNRKALRDINVRSLDTGDLNCSLLDSIVRMLNTEKSLPTPYAGQQQPSSMSSVRCLAAIRKHWNYLVHHMDPENGLLGTLLSKDIITFQQMETIEKSKTFFDKNEKLLKVIKTKNDTEFQVFIAALKDTNQKLVVKILQSK